MIQNEDDFKKSLYVVWQAGRTDSHIYLSIEKILNSINYKNELAIYSLGLIRKIDFYEFYKWKEIEIIEGRLDHLIDLEGISIRFFDIYDYNYLIDSIINLFFSSLVTEIDLICKILGQLIKFPSKYKKNPYLKEIKEHLLQNFFDHELTKLFKTEYSRNPKSWLCSMKDIRNNLHHGSGEISEIILEPELSILSPYDGPFYFNEKYFEEFVQDEDREVIKFCGKISQKTEWFLSEILEILSKDLNSINTVPLF